jgi:hypothetical protein
MIFTDWRDRDLAKLCSFFQLLDMLYRDKKTYYSGDKKFYSRKEENDDNQRFDGIERSIKAIHTEAKLKEWGCVEYDKEKHKVISEKNQYYQSVFKDLFNNRNN